MGLTAMPSYKLEGNFQADNYLPPLNIPTCTHFLQSVNTRGKNAVPCYKLEGSFQAVLLKYFYLYSCIIILLYQIWIYLSQLFIVLQ